MTRHQRHSTSTAVVPVPHKQEILATLAKFRLERPAKDWSVEQLAQYASCCERLALQMEKHAALVRFLQGAALQQIFDSGEHRRKWGEFLKTHRISAQTDRRVRMLFREAKTEKAVKGLGVMEAYRKFRIDIPANAVGSPHAIRHSKTPEKEATATATRLSPTSESGRQPKSPVVDVKFEEHPVGDILAASALKQGWTVDQQTRVLREHLGSRAQFKTLADGLSQVKDTKAFARFLHKKQASPKRKANSAEAKETTLTQGDIDATLIFVQSVGGIERAVWVLEAVRQQFGGASHG